MRISFIDNFIAPEGGRLELLDVHPHLGLLSIAAIAEQEGHRTQIYDPKRQVRSGALAYDHTLYDRAAEDILDQRPDIVGFTTLGCSYIFVLNVARIIKQRYPHIVIMLGGPHVTMLHRQTIERFPQVDIVVRHEAEETLPPLLENLETRDFAHIPGITWRDHAGLIHQTDGKPMVTDLDTLPPLKYEHYPVEDLDLDLMRIEAGRGCPYACTFCSTATFFQRSYRLKSPERLVQELDLLNQRYGVTEFKLDHDMFTVDRRKVLAFCDAVEDRGYQWRVSARVDRVDRELLERMAEAGCIGLYFGIETGSQRMQKVAKKGLKLHDVFPKVAICNELGIASTLSFITGYPNETEQDQNETLDMVGQAFTSPQGSSLTQLHMLVPEPGTLLYHQYADVMTFDGYTTAFNGSLLIPEDKQLVLDHPDLFPTYYYYPGVVPREMHTFAVDLYETIRFAGGIALGYLLRFYGGSLAKLNAHMRQWAQDNQRHERVDQRLILDFLQSCFGADHHLFSLYRYAFPLNRPGDDQFTIIGGTSRIRIKPSQRYQINPSLHLFHDLHDCNQLMERIHQSQDDPKPFDNASTGDLGSHLLIMRNGIAEHSQIDPGTHAIIEMFDEPVTCTDVAAAVHEATGGLQIEMDFFQSLLEKGILQEAKEPIFAHQEPAILEPQHAL